MTGKAKQLIAETEEKSVAETAMEAFIVSLCKTEVQLFKERENWKSDSQLTAYFQSTPHKSAFGRLMTKAALVTECYTIKEISLELNMTRQSVHRMVNDCLDAGWIEVCNSDCCNGDKTNYMASRELVTSTDGYARYLLQKLIETKALDNEILLYQLIKHGLM